MRKVILLAIALGAGIVFPVQASITDVTIQPETPTFNDDISLFVFGVESGTVTITDSTFIVDGTDLELNIDLIVGFLAVVTPWDHTEDIGTLSFGTYDLTVNTLVDLRPELNDTFMITFEVVPEPGTMLLLGLGGLMLRRKR